MNRHVLTVLLMFLLSAGLARAYDCDSSFRYSATKMDGTEVGLIVPTKQVKAAPRWAPGDGAPPLAISDAVDIALAWGRGEYTRYDTVAVSSIELLEYNCGDLSGRWYYVIRFDLAIDGNHVFGGGNFVAVLMDGTVTSPTVVGRGE